MKKFIVTLTLFTLILLLWAILGMKKMDSNFFLSSSVLDTASPSGVNIDIDFIKNLNPAYGK